MVPAIPASPGQQAVLFRLRRLSGAVPKGDVAQLVGHHTREFAFVTRRIDRAAIDVHRSAGKGEGIDVSDIHDLEVVVKLRMLKLRRNGIHQALTDARQIIRGLTISQGWVTFVQPAALLHVQVLRRR